MDPVLLIVYALILGAAVGAGATFALLLLKQAIVNRQRALHPQIPQLAIDLFNHLDFPAIVLDSSLSPVYTNLAARQDETAGATVFADPDFLARMREVMQTGKSYLRLPDSADAQHDTYRVQALRVQRRFVAVLIQDFGEQQRLNTMRRDFIANISHELKTPTAAITLLAEAVQEAKHDPNMVAQFAQSMHKEAKRLGELTRDIINLSKAETELQPEKLEPVDLLQLLETQVEAHSNYAQQRDVQLIVTPRDPQTQAFILGRKNALGIAIANVLSNAIGHSRKNSSVGVGFSFQNGMLNLSISDKGPGIAPEYQERIFERFFRVNSARTRGEDNGGTGLGLSIARHTLRSHGGDITVWSKVGTGSTFTMSFPLATQAQLDAASHKNSGKKKQGAKKHKHAHDLAAHAEFATHFIQNSKTRKK